MSPLLVQLINGAVLVIVLIGVPAVSSVRLGGLQLSSRSVWEALTLWGLAVAALTNLAAAVLVARRAAVRRACLGWSVGFGILLGVEFLFFAGFIHFRWLKAALIWVRDRLSGGF